MQRQIAFETIVSLCSQKDFCSPFYPTDHSQQVFLSPRPSLIDAEAVPFDRLPDEAWTQWETLRQDVTAYSSPFFSSRFISITAKLRPASQMIIASRQGSIVGLLPCELVKRDVIEPLGKSFNDAHGILCSANRPVDIIELLKATKLTAFRFHALAGNVVSFEPYVLGHSKSFMAPLDQHPEGYVGYLEQKSGTIQKQRRKTKKLVKQHGPLRLEVDCRCPKVLQQTIQWKREQYSRNYLFDILGVSWAQAMLNELWQFREGCRGLLSALYAGDTLVASHFGLLDGETLHYWFPTYDHQYREASPGTAMFLEMATQVTHLGIRKIDLGYGDHDFKHKIADTITEVPFGFATTSRLGFYRESLLSRSQQWVRSLPGKQHIKRLIRRFTPSIDRHLFE